MDKKRLDIVLVEKEFFSSRQRARGAIMAGQVLVDGVLVDKAGTPITEEQTIRIIGETNPYVSRGGYKLEKARTSFQLNFKDKVVADIGASTGGFTDVSLLAGAKRVYAIDVGYGQLAWSLRQDPRVVVMERTNARYLAEKDFPEKMDMVVTDVSFISLEKIMTAISKILAQDGQLVALIKPQFEAGRDRVGKHGVVKDFAVHREVIEKVIAAGKKHGFFLLNLDHSPIIGPKGNIEYLIHLHKQAPTDLVPAQALIDDVIKRAKSLRR